MYVLLLLLSALIFTGVSVYYLRHPGASVFHPATWYLAFHGIVFVIRPLFGAYYGYSKMYQAIQFTPSMADKITVIVAANVGMLVFVFVSLTRSKHLDFKQNDGDIDQRNRLLYIFVPIAVVLAITTINAFILLWQIRATSSQFMEFDARTGGTALVGVNGYFISLVSMLTPISAILVYLSRYKMWSLGVFVAFAALRFGTGGRGDVIAAASMIALFFLYDRRLKWPNWLTLAGAALMMPAFFAIGDDRGAALRESFGFANEEVVEGYQSEFAPMESMDLASMEFFEYIAYVVPQRSGTYDYFLNNLQIFTEPIPRSIWPDKPIGAPIIRLELYKWGQPVGATMSLPGAGWYNWGYLGVVIWTCIFALIYGSAYLAFSKSNQSNLKVIAYVIFIATSIISFRDGTIVTILKQCLFYYIPLVLLALAAKGFGILDGAAAVIGRPVGRPGVKPAETPKARRLASSQTQSAGGADMPGIIEMSPRERRHARSREP